MAWVRIDDQAPRNEKMLKAGPAACWLWVCGIAHCQSQLTDGFISAAALPMIGVANNYTELADTLIKARLWKAAAGGYRVHDYLEFNQSRAQVLAKRAEDSARKRTPDSGRRSNGVAPDSMSASGRNPRGKTSESKVSRARVPSHPIPSEQKEQEALSAENGNGHRQQPVVTGAVYPIDPVPTNEVSDRARDFIDRYRITYAKVRSGATYPFDNPRDYKNIVKLVTSWPDIPRLDLMLEIFLHMDAKDSLNRPGTPGQFLNMAPDCDQRLRESGR